MAVAWLTPRAGWMNQKEWPGLPRVDGFGGACEDIVISGSRRVGRGTEHKRRGETKLADTFGTEINVGPPPIPPRKQRSFGLIGVVALLLLLGIGGALVWLNLDAVTDMLHGSAAPATSTASGSDVLASATDPSVSAAEFAAFQQRTGDAIQTATGLLNAQQTEIRRLSDQIQGLTLQVTNLTSRLEQAQPGRAPSPPAAAAGAVAPAPTTARTAPVAPRKRTPADRPAGAISVGGAPLPGAR